MSNWKEVRNESDIQPPHPEAIHTAQMKELLYLPFYLLYVLEWLYRLMQLQDSRKAYRAISHEREAYDNQGNPDYLTERKPYNQFNKIWH